MTFFSFLCIHHLPWNLAIMNANMARATYWLFALSNRRVFFTSNFNDVRIFLSSDLSMNIISLFYFCIFQFFLKTLCAVKLVKSFLRLHPVFSIFIYGLSRIQRLHHCADCASMHRQQQNLQRLELTAYFGIQHFWHRGIPLLRLAVAVYYGICISIL